jgi:hypothetical protein
MASATSLRAAAPKLIPAKVSNSIAAQPTTIRLDCNVVIIRFPYPFNYSFAKRPE